MKLLGKIIGLCFGASCVFNAAKAQDSLPKGIGAYGYSFRSYDQQSQSFNADGHKAALGKAYSKDFNGQNLLAGAGGSDLQRLAEQLQRFDGNSNARDSLINSLRLGKLEVDVSGEVKAQGFGLGYGFTDNISAFVIVPWVDAQIQSSFNYVNDNNIEAIRGRLGNLAFGELQSGFDRAANISSQQIIDNLQNLGYSNLDSWSYQGLGDIAMNVQYSNKVSLGAHTQLTHGLKSQIDMPTGHADDPNILNDVAIGRGYFVWTNTYSPTLVTNNVKLGLSGSYGYGLPTNTDRRVPIANESLVDQDRLAEVYLQPGWDYGYGINLGYQEYAIKPKYSLGITGHTRDSYSGGIEGNYDKLSEGSDNDRLYQEIGLSFDTVSLYEKKKFALPFIADLSYHQTLSGRNTVDISYVQFSISSFFATPYSSSDMDKNRKVLVNKSKSSSRGKKSKVAH